MNDQIKTEQPNEAHISQSELNAELEADTTYTIASYRYPYNLLPEYHTALYQLLVGIEQRHSQENLDAYAKNLRRLADSAYVDFSPNVKLRGCPIEKG